MIEFDLSQALNDSYDWDAVCASLESELSVIKAAGGGEESNEAWRRLQIFSIWKDYKSIYHALKNGDYYEAWCEIEQVLITNQFLLRNFPADTTCTEFITSHLIALQQLFPYRLFMSSVMEIEEENCSICGAKISPWTHCGHRPGKVYNGELCLKVVNKMKFLGADIVTHPEHKYSVIFAKDEKGEREDRHDYSMLKTLIQYWQRPFQDWKIKREERFLPPYEGLKDSDICPCLRGIKTYAECCKNSPGIFTYHYTIFPNLIQ